MKTKRAGILLACMCMVVTVTIGVEIPGDINEDGELTTLDLDMGRQYILHNGQSFGTEIKTRGDMNGDGKLTTFDLILMRVFIASGGTKKWPTPGVDPSLGDWQIYSAPNRPTCIPKGKPAVFAAMRFFASEPLKEGSIMFAIENSTDIRYIHQEMMLSIGNHLLIGTITVVDNAYDHVGTVNFDLTGVEIDQGETEALLIGQVEEFAQRSLVFTWRETGKTQRQRAGKKDLPIYSFWVYPYGPGLMNLCEVR